jgi:hypothetical protein
VNFGTLPTAVGRESALRTFGRPAPAVANSGRYSFADVNLQCVARHAITRHGLR